MENCSALACGNTVVIKPAENTSLTALKLAEIIQESNLPKGVVNIVTGASQTGEAIVNHPDIDKIAFTGSTEVGKIIQKSLVGINKTTTLELGGKGANIIFEDAAIEQAVEGIVNAIFFNQGHVCCAGSRLFIQESVAKTVVQKLKNRMSSLVVGNPLDKNTDIGAINSKEQLNKINNYIKAGKQEERDLSVRLQSSSNRELVPSDFIFKCFSVSYYSSRRDFGPVLTIQTFRTVEEVIEKANNTPFGLSAGVWTEKGSKIFKLSQELNAGVVWANTYNKFDPSSPFGGFKESGIGREGGVHGLRAYLKFE